MIVNVYPGRDGLIRSVDVKTKKGIFNTSIQTLHEFEIRPQLYSEGKALSNQVVSGNIVDSSGINKDTVSAVVQDPDEIVNNDASVYTRRG